MPVQCQGQLAVVFLAKVHGLPRLAVGGNHLKGALVVEKGVESNGKYWFGNLSYSSSRSKIQPCVTRWRMPI